MANAITNHLSKLSLTVAVAAVLVAVPWLNPFAAPPISTVQPALIFVSSVAILVGLVAAAPITRKGLWNAACLAWVAAPLLNTVLALMQYFGVADSFDPWVNTASLGEAYGNLRQRNLFASSCAIGLAVMVWHVDCRPSSHAFTLGGLLRRLGLGLAVVALSVGLAVSMSRTGMAELILLWMLVWLWRRNEQALSNDHFEKRHLLTIGTATYFAASWLLPKLSGHEGSSITRLIKGDELCVSRLLIWKNMWQIALQKPLLGWGWGEVPYAQFMTLVEGPRSCEYLDNAHNLPLHLAVTLGFPLACLVFALTCWVVIRAQPGQANEPVQRVAWAILALIGVHSLLEFPLWYGQFQFAFLISAWYLNSYRGRGRRSENWLYAAVMPSPKARIATLALVPAVLWICNVVWDSYYRIHLVYLPENLRPAEYAKGFQLNSRDVLLFVNEASFARLHMELNPGNAQSSLDIACNLLHANVSPIAVEKIIASLNLLGRPQEAQYYEIRYQAAFPKYYANWVANGRTSKFFQTNASQ